MTKQNKNKNKSVVKVGRILFAPTFDCIQFKLRGNFSVGSLNVSKVFNGGESQR